MSSNRNDTPRDAQAGKAPIEQFAASQKMWPFSTTI